MEAREVTCPPERSRTEHVCAKGRGGQGWTGDRNQGRVQGPLRDADKTFGRAAKGHVWTEAKAVRGLLATWIDGEALTKIPGCRNIEFGFLGSLGASS